MSEDTKSWVALIVSIIAAISVILKEFLLSMS